MNPDRIPRAFRPFVDGRYRLLITALTMSLFGGGVWLVAMVGTVFHIGGGPIELSIIATGNAVGMIVAVLVGGAIAAAALIRRYRHADSSQPVEVAA